ncbi:SH3 domain-containing protein [Leptospira ognonensis]|uniref:SH3 domain-containing protein n=1 Tax=Leptospira ognonensis TaxID=2484945 RepID=A0A4R9JXF2_9LEPT|nr:SH3 domain-containing protein [Leptospira ognonensis]TGL57877.1 SH3 domain-containing protein [Leptospira ognonensis]
MNKTLASKFQLKLLSVVLALFPISALLPCDRYDAIPFKKGDHSSKDTSFLEFKTKLEKAIQTKDVQFIASISDPEISFAFEEGSMGKKKFLKSWNLDKNPKVSLFWEEFAKMIPLGYAVDNDGLWTVPYFFSNHPDTIDPYSDSLVIGERVNIRELPDKNAKVLTQISWEFVKNIYDQTSGQEKKKAGEPCIWKKVCLPSGQIGYVCDQYLRSPFSYRAGFLKKQNKWQMVFFTTGSD